MTGKDMQLFNDNIANEDYYHNTIRIALREIYGIMKEGYGPYGSHVLIDNKIRPAATKDGRTILSNVRMNGSIANSVLRSIISVADKQVEEVGDGSTTTILLLCRLYEYFRDIIRSTNTSPSTFQKELQKVVSYLNTKVVESAKQIVTTEEDGGLTIDYDTLRNAVHTSVDGDEAITNTICDMFIELNCIEPLILIENSANENHSYDLVKGAEISGAIINADIFFNGFSRREYENPSVLVVNGRFDINADRYMDLINENMRNGTSLIVLATGISDALIETLTQIHATQPGIFQSVPIFQIRETAIDEEFRDMCATLGATYVDSETVKKWATTPIMTKTIDACSGKCSKALLTEFCARFTDPASNDEQIDTILKDVNQKLIDLKNDPSSHNERISDLESRKAFLSRHYAKFYVGGASPQRKAINYELVNDGIPQAISCMKHGIVPGCNMVVPEIIDLVLMQHKTGAITMTVLEELIYMAIGDAYHDMFVQLIANKDGEIRAADIAKNHIELYGRTPLNLRDDTEVINSADTDRAILEFATDMASLLATSRAFLSLNSEFDIISKNVFD